MNHEVDTCEEVSALLGSWGVDEGKDTCEEDNSGMMTGNGGVGGVAGGMWYVTAYNFNNNCD